MMPTIFDALNIELGSCSRPIIVGPWPFIGIPAFPAEGPETGALPVAKVAK